ncbi:fimbrillin family protein [Bacteroides helcogenes]|uniref:Fimbrillin family protein n=1 Tax=Bacteroides helcogenes (strain ATCC 35417 / DSM 20613 / JCM 6297 / CCUG 15421 / P 36-108) TaxID=693979 RepID=E6SU18_BACT6|nr:fimbrillin family protein [Bacteroides helcogenes]ADV43319.1 hypothetical protein Bache_1312 [Bacteroides helcogenes P 36-108]MDY5238655.1 fimbrillin family protein [Bacteroides helcogenes]
MNKKTFSLFVRRRSVRAIVLLTITVTAMLASCSSEDMTDNSVETLPEGMYPLTFTATQGEVVATPQSRVSENTDGASSKWTGGEVINVAIGAGGLGTATDITCTLKADGSVSTCSKQLYWQNTQSSTVSAWYSNIAGQGTMTNNTVSLDKQNTANGLAYVLKTDEISPKYNTDNGKIALNFKHQLAKVRVKVVKGSYTGDLNVTAVSVNGYTSCTVSNGDVSPSGSLNPIQMKQNGDYWEANLVPGTGALGDVITINADSKSTTCTLASAVTLTAAQMYTYEVTVNQAGPTVITGGQTITESGNYIIKGEFTQGITLNGDNIKLTLDNVTANTDTPIKILSGTPVIKITGTNKFTTKDGTPGIHLDGSDANVEITGDGSESSSLEIKVEGTNNGFPGSGIGSFGSYNSCGNIKISNIKLTVQGGYDWSYDASGAAIGTGAGWSGSCGSITIEKSVVFATALTSAAAIGFGSNDSRGGSIPSITITDSQLNLTVTGEGAGIGFGLNYRNVAQTLGPVKITSSNENESTFFAKERFNVEGYKVGKSSNNYSNQSWEGVTFNGKTLVDGSSNGYK